MSFLKKLLKKDHEPQPTTGSNTQTAAQSPTAAPSDEQADGPKRSQKKGDTFLRFARDSADKHQYDYALEMYHSAIRHDPANMMLHEEMYEVAKKRAAAGGGLIKKIKANSKHPTDRLIAGIHIAATAPLDGLAMIQFAQNAGAAHAAEPGEGIPAAVQFWGEKALQLVHTQGNEKTRLSTYEKAMGWFEASECYDLALICCRRVITAKGMTDQLMQKLKEYEAGEYAQKNTSSEKGGFRENIKDADAQRQLEMQDASVKTEDTKDKLIEAARAFYDEDPTDLERTQKLVKALLNKQEHETENEAIELLEAAFGRLGTYKLKAQADDIKIRQFKRQQQAIEKQIKSGDAGAKDALLATKKQRNAFELEVFAERAQKYPTDMGIRYDLGIRQYSAGQYDEAIGSFQQASADAKVRARSYQYLALCFVKEDLLDEAVQTIDRGIDAHPHSDDALGLSMRYHKMDALERKARKQTNLQAAQDAQSIASDILQKSISYRDIKDRMAKIKQLIQDLQSA